MALDVSSRMPNLAQVYYSRLSKGNAVVRCGHECVIIDCKVCFTTEIIRDIRTFDTLNDRICEVLSKHAHDTHDAEYYLEVAAR